MSMNTDMTMNHIRSKAQRINASHIIHFTRQRKDCAG